MSKILKELNEASKKRADVISPVKESREYLITNSREGKMRNSWFTWAFIVAAVAMVFVTLNYHGGKDAVPLSEIFPDEEVFPVGVEYEFVEEETKVSQVHETAQASKEIEVEVPVKSDETNPLPIENISKDTEFNYTVQIASFKNKKRAEEALADIRKKVPSAYIGSQDLGAKGVWHRIYAGQFQLKSEAEMSLTGIKQNYNDSFIISPKMAK